MRTTIEPTTYVARVAGADGRDRLGTDGVIGGRYRSRATFTRYRLRPYAAAGTTYNIYLVDDSRGWHFLGTYVRAGQAETETFRDRRPTTRTT